MAVYTEISAILNETNVCQRCILRFCCVKDHQKYLSKDSMDETFKALFDGDTGREPTVKSENGVEPSTKRFLPSICSGCLGLLQEQCDEVCKQIEDSISKTGHIYEDFVLGISMPVAVDLRDKLLLYYLNEKLSDKSFYDDKDVPSVKEIYKSVVGVGFEKRTNRKCLPASDFEIMITLSYEDMEKECEVLLTESPEAFPNARRKKKNGISTYNRTSVLKAIDVLSTKLKNIYPLPPPTPSVHACVQQIRCSYSPILLGGRYNKYSRELSQTPWVLDGVRKMESSVQELITAVVSEKIHADKIVFSASGREDVDVRMLGNGRPFVLEILNPRSVSWSQDVIKSIEEEINKSTSLVAVKHLQVISKDDLSLLKEGEEKKKKTYSALCVVEKNLTIKDKEALERLQDLKLCQKTPIRVLHRRTLSTREKILHSMNVTLLDDHHMKLAVETQAGTYVKEFVHGDFGRTTPNLGTLLETTADILELDVEEIDLEWPTQ